MSGRGKYICELVKAKENESQNIKVDTDSIRVEVIGFALDKNENNENESVHSSHTVEYVDVNCGLFEPDRIIASDSDVIGLALNTKNDVNNENESFQSGHTMAYVDEKTGFFVIGLELDRNINNENLSAQSSHNMAYIDGMTEDFVGSDSDAIGTASNAKNAQSSQAMEYLDEVTGFLVVDGIIASDSEDVAVSDVSISNSSANYEPSSNEESFSQDESDVGPLLDSTSGRPKRGRKMKFLMTRTESKINRNKNQPCINQRGTLKPAKEFLYNYNCNCTLKCREVLSVDHGKQEFDRFWDLGSYNAQTLFLASLIIEMPKKRLYGRNTEKRLYSRKYSIANKRVCRQMFVNTLRITPSRVTTALKKANNRAPLLDQRGKQQGGLNKISENRIQEVINQIDKIPKYTSHYCREQTSASFLPPHLSLGKMYDIYRNEVDHPVTFAIYKRIFLTKFNLKFKVPQKDTCQVCDSFKIKIQEEPDEHNKQLLQIQLNTHHDLAQKARNELQKDLDTARNENNMECLTFDLQKTLPLPRIPTNIIFYKRQVWLYHLGVYSGKFKKSYSYIWLEGAAGRGSQEVGSCLLRHSENIPNTVEHLILWSDSCGGQNRNIKITLMMASLLQASAHLKTITFKFLVPGHSFLPNDKDFGDIECQLKRHERLYTPSDYINIIKSCRKKIPFIITEMKNEWFLGTQKLEKATVNRKFGTEKEKINWLKTRQIVLKKDNPYHIFMMPDFNVESICLDIQRRGRVNTQTFSELLVQLWPNGKPLAEPKVQDIKSYMHLIPDDAKAFYENFTSSPNILEDVEGFNVNDVDFEIDA